MPGGCSTIGEVRFRASDEEEDDEDEVDDEDEDEVYFSDFMCAVCTIGRLPPWILLLLLILLPLLLLLLVGAAEAL